jgi:hypothetical protein
MSSILEYHLQFPHASNILKNNNPSRHYSQLDNISIHCDLIYKASQLRVTREAQLGGPAAKRFI